MRTLSISDLVRVDEQGAMGGHAMASTRRGARREGRRASGLSWPLTAAGPLSAAERTAAGACDRSSAANRGNVRSQDTSTRRLHACGTRHRLAGASGRYR